jgi:5-methylcytosine-specific restriction endonuclease McrA
MSRVPFAKRVQYERHIRSSAWKELAERALERDGRACRMCGASKSASPVRLEGHHRSYLSLGTERELDDVTTLCASCHAWYSKRDETVREIIRLREQVERYRRELEGCRGAAAGERATAGAQ